MINLNQFKDAWDAVELFEERVSEYAGSNAIWFFFSLSIGLIGIAHAAQSTTMIHKSLGYVLAVLGLIMMLSNIIEFGDPVGFAFWIIYTLVSVFSGVLLIKTKAL